MKTILNISALVLLLAIASSPCFAMMDLGFVSRKEAKEMGIELRSKPAGPDAVWLELEFKAEGKLKGYSRENFSRVELRIMDGKKLLLGYAPLQERRSSSGTIVVRFMANRGYLDKIILWIVVGSGQMSGGGYELKVKDFVDFKNLNEKLPNTTAPTNTRTNLAPTVP